MLYSESLWTGGRAATATAIIEKVRHMALGRNEQEFRVVDFYLNEAPAYLNDL